MNYYVAFFLNHLPLVMEETRVVNGQEESCLIIPTKSNFLRRGKTGNWRMSCVMYEVPVNRDKHTHVLSLYFGSGKEIKKAMASGIYERTRNMGRARLFDNNGAKVYPVESRIDLDGRIILSDIPKNLIFRNANNAKRYLTGLTLAPDANADFVYTGSICIDDIPRDAIRTDERGGKFIGTHFISMDAVDHNKNTHRLMVRTDHGEVEIGFFREWRRTQPAPARNPYPVRPQSTNEDRNNRPYGPGNIPNTIDGYKY